MKKSVFYLLSLILILFLILNHSQNIKILDVDKTNLEIPIKISSLNFDIVEDSTMQNGYSAVVSYPVKPASPKPIPMPPEEPKPIPANTENIPYKIIVDVSKQRVSVMVRDEDEKFTIVHRQFPCSSGASGTPTKIGTFSVGYKNPWLISHATPTASGDEYRVYARYKTNIVNDYHFHSILYQDMYNHKSLLRSSFYNMGHRASHGCVRLLVRDAKWIYNHCDRGTEISIVWRGGPDKDESVYQPIPLNQKLPSRVHFDPTDLAHVNTLNID